LKGYTGAPMKLLPKIHKEDSMILTTNECFICMETCQDQDQIKLNCAHTMCTNCITECMKKKDTCPFCRKPITDIYTNNTEFILPHQRVDIGPGPVAIELRYQVYYTNNQRVDIGVAIGYQVPNANDYNIAIGVPNGLFN